jgi:hypothetical protein
MLTDRDIVVKVLGAGKDGDSTRAEAAGTGPGIHPPPTACRVQLRAVPGQRVKQAALKCLYLVTRSLDPTGQGRARWTMRWKPVLNAFAITFADQDHRA